MDTLNQFSTSIISLVNHPQFVWVVAIIFIASAVVVAGMVAKVLYDQHQRDKDRIE